MLSSRWVALFALLFAESCLASGEVGGEAESYLCIAKQSSGFIFDKKSGAWVSRIVRPDLKIVVVKHKVFKWVVKEVGNELTFHSYCEDDFKNDSLYCTGYNEFRMSRSDLRFMSAGLHGYWNESRLQDSPLTYGDMHEEGDFQPYFHIGECSVLQ